MTKQKNKTTLLVTLVVVLVLAALLLIYLLLFHKPPEQNIQLPEEPAVPVQETQLPEEEEPADQFLQVSPQSLPQVMQTLSAPEAYYEKRTILLAAGSGSGEQTVELWRCGEKQRARITTGASGQVKNVLEDENGISIWYEGLDAVTTVSAPAVSFARLCGLPRLEELAQLPENRVLTTEYMTLAQQNDRACLYVETMDEAGTIQTNWWLDLDTGLPLLVQRAENAAVFYTQQQTDFRILTPADADYTAAFELP